MLRGLTTGVVKLRGDTDLRPCVVFGDEYSSWIPVLRELGYRAILVLLRTDKYLAAVEDSVEDNCAIWSGADWSVFQAAMPSFGVHRQMMGFVDGRVTGELRIMSEGMGIQTLVGTKGLRRAFRGWKMASQRVEHAAVGGVTAGVATVTALTRGDTVLTPAALPYVVARDASTVLSVKPFVRTFRANPGPVEGVALVSLNLGTHNHPYYHGGGLLPELLDRGVRVLAPALFAPPGQWGLRGNFGCKGFLTWDGG
jgi:hypothetical protein